MHTLVLVRDRMRVGESQEEGHGRADAHEEPFVVFPGATLAWP